MFVRDCANYLVVLESHPGAVPVIVGRIILLSFRIFMLTGDVAWLSVAFIRELVSAAVSLTGISISPVVPTVIVHEAE